MAQLSERTRVLIVDDEPQITNTLVNIFSNRGYEARGVYSAEQAIELVKDWSPDLAILDVLLPEMNGIEFAILLRVEFPHCHLLLFSGETATQELVDASSDQGHSFDIMAKPTHPERLLDWAAEQAQHPNPKPN